MLIMISYFVYAQTANYQKKEMSLLAGTVYEAIKSHHLECYDYKYTYYAILADKNGVRCSSLIKEAWNERTQDYTKKCMTIKRMLESYLSNAQNAEGLSINEYSENIEHGYYEIKLMKHAKNNENAMLTIRFEFIGK